MKQRGLVAAALAIFISLMFIGGCQDQPTTAPGITAQSSAPSAPTSLQKDAGFDQFGYNYTARLFNGTGDGVDRVLDGTVWGDPTYANDHLVMKWSKAWDDARFNGAPWTPEAWEDNEWNGNVPGGSGTTEHTKIIWVGPSLENSNYWREGGVAIWGQFEVIFDQGKIDQGRVNWYTHANPSGYGMK